MLSNFLVAHPWMSPTILALLVAGGPFAGAWLARRRGPAIAATVGSFVILAIVVLSPTSRSGLTVGCVAEWALPTVARVELAANVVLMVPPAVCVGVLRGRASIGFIAGTVASALIETIQAVAPTLGRSCSTNDWLANTLGAALGAFIALAALHLAGRRRISCSDSATNGRHWRRVR